MRSLTVDFDYFVHTRHVNADTSVLALLDNRSQHSLVYQRAMCGKKDTYTKPVTLQTRSTTVRYHRHAILVRHLHDLDNVFGTSRIYDDGMR